MQNLRVWQRRNEVYNKYEGSLKVFDKNKTTLALVNTIEKAFFDQSCEREVNCTMKRC